MPKSKLKVDPSMTESEKEQVMQNQMLAHRTQRRAEARQAEVIAVFMALADKYGDRILELIQQQRTESRRAVISISVNARTGQYMDYVKRLTGMHWGQQMDLMALLLKQIIPTKWTPLDADVEDYQLEPIKGLYQDVEDEDEAILKEYDGLSNQELVQLIDKETAALKKKASRKK